VVRPRAAVWRGCRLAAGGAEIRRRGGHVGGYFIYDRVDRLPVHSGTFLGHYPKSDYPVDVPWDTAAQQHALLTIDDPAGVVPPPEPTAAELAEWRTKIDEHAKLYAAGQRAAPVQWWQGVWIDDPAWRDYLAGWVADKYVGEWGANTAYIDVMGTGNADLDYDPRRGHNGDGGWGPGRLRLAAELARRGRAHDPTFGLTQEGLGDLPGRWAAMMCSGVYGGERNVVRYAFPDRILIHGMANAGGSGTGSAWSRFLATFREAMRWDIVGGATALPVNLLNLSRPLMPELFQARFRDTEGLAVSDAAVQVRRLDATSTAVGATIVTVTNPRFRPARLSLDGLAAAAAFELTLDGGVRAVPAAAELTLSRQAASLWILAARERSGSPVWPLLTFDRPGRALVLHLLNLSGQVAEGTARLTNLGYVEPYQDRLAEATASLTTGGEQPYAIRPGQLAALRFPLLRRRARLDHAVPDRPARAPARGVGHAVGARPGLRTLRAASGAGRERRGRAGTRPDDRRLPPPPAGSLAAPRPALPVDALQPAHRLRGSGARRPAASALWRRGSVP